MHKIKTYRESTSTPRAPTPHFTVVAHQMKRRLIPQRHINNSMMRQRTHRRHRRTLLPTTLRPRRHKQPSILPPVPTRLPLPTRAVPEGTPLGWEIAIAGRNSEQEGVVLFELFRARELGDRGVFGRRVHFREDFVWQRFLHAEEVDGPPGSADAFGFGLGEGLDVAVHGVLW